MEDKTPEKSGVETPTQTTPSLKTTASPPQPIPTKVLPAAPKFEDKPLSKSQQKSVREQFKEQVRAAKLSESDKSEVDSAPRRNSERVSESEKRESEGVVVIDDVKLIENEIMKENISLGEEVKRISESEKSEKKISESDKRRVTISFKGSK